MQDTQLRLVGPIVSDPDLAIALADVIEKDNDNQEVFYDDRGGYIRIHLPKFCRITRNSMREALQDDSFQLPDIEPKLVSFAGRMRYVGDEELHFYLED